MSDHYYPHPLHRRESVLSRKKSRKRKRKESEDDADSVSSLDSIKAPSSQSTWAEFKSNDVLQRKAAGLSAAESIPSNHFPHRPENYKRYLGGALAPLQIQKELANLKPPLIDHIQHQNQQEFSRSSLKQQHITALNTLLHKCLLDKDYVRAGRAFGLLLRTENLGKTADLRDKNLWGIGAEILLFRRREEGTTNSYQKGIEDARQYLESLIVLFPYRSKAPDAVSAVQFYRVLFGFWIASLDEKYKTAVKSVENSGESGQGYSIRQIDELHSVRKSILVDAQAIVQRLDEVMRSIPYSDDPALWRLKGDMYLWIDELSQHEVEEGVSTSDSDKEQVFGHEPSTSARKNAQAAYAMAASYEQAEKNPHIYVYDSDDT